MTEKFESSLPFVRADDLPSVQLFSVQWPVSRLRRPIPAYEGQDFADLARGMDPYSAERKTNITKFPVTHLKKYTIEDGYFVIGHGLDGTILTKDRQIVEEASCFRDLSRYPDSMFEFPQPQAQDIFDEVFIGFDAAWRNYYHWLCYGLSKIYLADKFFSKQCLMIAPDYDQLVRFAPARFTQEVFESSIKYGGLGGRLKRLGEGIYRARKIHFFWHSPRMPEMVAHLRVFRDYFDFVSKNVPESTTPKRIFITREQSFDPRLSPEQSGQIEEFLISKDFVKIALEQHNFADQCNIFKGAEIVVAPHGAGLANVLFASNKLKVLEINSFLSGQSHLRPCFYVFCSALGQPYMFLNASIDQIDKNVMEHALDRLIPPQKSLKV